MSAQRALADWLADRGKYPPSVWAGAGGLILAEHGPAIAELIEAQLEFQNAPTCKGALDAGARIEVIMAKLTEPKA